MKYIIDRIEQNIAICEDENGNIVEIPKENLPQDIKEGSCIIEQNSIYILDENSTNKKREEIKKRMDNLWK